jgi:hypothetical protein
MQADTSVKYFHSEMIGAPVLTGTAGSRIAVLEALLVNGFGLKTVDSLVVSGNVATANISTGHSAEQHTVVLIAGATPAGLNGEWKVTSTTGATVSFITEDIADQTATGSITLKLAPAGWAKPFSGTNLAAFQPTDPTSSQNFLRIDDTGTTVAVVRGYESMSSIDVGTGPFPTVAQRASGLWWQKSSTASATARKWMMASDGLLFYFGVEHSTTLGVYDIGVFGEPLSTKSGDPYSCQLFGRGDSGVGTPVAAQQYPYAAAGLIEQFMARSYTGLGSAVQMTKCFPGIHNSATTQSGAASSIPYPNPADGGLYVAPHYLLENSPIIFRAVSPGFYCSPQLITPGSFAAKDLVTGVSGMPGRTLVVIQSYYSTPPQNQTAFIDITGPWR